MQTLRDKRKKRQKKYFTWQEPKQNNMANTEKVKSENRQIFAGKRELEKQDNSEMACQKIH